MKTLREMYPDGMYTDNSRKVFVRFKELLKGDVNDDDEVDYDSDYNYSGLPSDEELRLVQYDSASIYNKGATYLTNEEFFDITLKLDQAGNLDDELGFDLIGDLEEPNISVGQLIKQLQQEVKPNSPEVYFSDDGNITLMGHGDCRVIITDKTGAEIDEIYHALVVLMNV